MMASAISPDCPLSSSGKTTSGGTVSPAAELQNRRVQLADRFPVEGGKRIPSAEKEDPFTRSGSRGFSSMFQM